MARLEGDAAPRRGRPPKQPIEGLAGIVDAFKASHPIQWEELRLCPLQHGLENMIELIG